ncbi:Aldo/keto reductase [Sulfidibacter corallicola]|uniref:Aldo/keto reductase n=1 Tax=Sulfidibacter corallicola TaxID=2818388 RepID=A0A8A4TND7_SULCO|nr:aldo/keto reductase [Sulfidibacter corallicola]QTD50411.1 aldo/keto reductase [Sulfidibacter corallicola]
MRYEKLGRTDIDLSKIIMGTWQAGKRMWSGIEDRDSIQALQAAFDSGITTFDTAEVYGEGHSEQIIGKALGNHRHQIVILSKVFSNHLRYDQVFEACHRSLKNLGTDYLDLYQIHWPPGTWGGEEVPPEETMRALCELVQQGKIRAIGVSNFNAEQIAEASRYGRIDSLQPPYSLFWRAVEAETLPYCREQDQSVLAYSSLAQGILADRFAGEIHFEPGDHRAKNRLFQEPHWTRVQAALAELRPIAKACGMTMAQLALAWITTKPGMFAIAGARRAEQIRETAAAGMHVLSDGDWAEVDRIGRTVTDHLDDNPLLWNF